MLSNMPPLNTPEAQHRWAMFVEGNTHKAEDGRVYTEKERDVSGANVPGHEARGDPEAGRKGAA